MHKIFVLAFAACLALAPSANAEILITNRSSLLSTNIDFGYLGSVTTSTDSLSHAAIDDAQLLRQGTASDGGPLGDISWDSSYQYSVEQQLVPGSPQGFSGAGSLSLFTFVAGDGVSYLTSTNRLQIEFQNTAAGAFDLSFLATPQSSINLEKLTSPGVWDTVYAHPGGFDEYATTLPLAAGAYRLTAETLANTDNGANAGSWSFSVVAVPEPTSLVLLAIAASCLLLRMFHVKHSANDLQSASPQE